MSDKLDSRQVSTLNALVTFAAEHVPGGLSADEQEVARTVGDWALRGAPWGVEPVSRIGYMGDDD